MLFDLATAAGLEEKRNKMASGAHINATEDRAGKLLSNVRIMGVLRLLSVMHVGLRCPKGKSLYVDGEDVVPAVHNVLDKVNF